MSFSATLTMVMSIIAIRAAIITTIVMPTLDPESSSRLISLSTLDPLAPRPLGSSTPWTRSLRLDAGRRTHAGPQRELRVWVEPDQHRHPLHDLGEVARGVVGR